MALALPLIGCLLPLNGVSTRHQSVVPKNVKGLRPEVKAVAKEIVASDTSKRSRPMGRIAALQPGVSGRSTFGELRNALLFEARQLTGKRTTLVATKHLGETANGRPQESGLDEDRRSNQGKTRTVPVASAILENYRRGRSSLEELVLELYHAEVSVKAVDDLTASLWGHPLNSEAIGELSRQATNEIAAWLERPLAHRFKMIFAEGTVLRWRAGHEEHCVPILAAMGVNEAGYREIVGVVEGSKTEAADFATLFRSLRDRGVNEVDLFVGDHLSGFVSGLREVFPKAAFQGCITRFSERAMELTTSGQLSLVDTMLDEIYGCRDAAGARAKIRRCVVTLEQIHQRAVAGLLREQAEPTLTFFRYPESLKPVIASNATLIRNLRTIRERARTIGAFSGGATAVTLATARLRHDMRATWGRYRYGSSERGAPARARSSV